MATPPPPPTDTVLLAVNAAGKQIVSIHSKVTYRILPNGSCLPADDQQPLLVPTADPEAEPIRETDVTPVKTGTDLIVLATAHAPRVATREMTASISIGKARWDYLVIGDRRCLYSGPGTLAFTPPEPFDTIPLRYERAYGGVDEAEPDPPVETALDAFKLPAGVYPRNPVGRGYVVRETPALDGLLLPNVEHPGERLTPKSLVVGSPSTWWRQPRPWSCDWFDKGWYPRVTYFGGLPDHLPDDDAQVAEVRLGLVLPRQNARHAKLRLEEALDARFANAASPALVLPFLAGTETIFFSGMSAQGQLAVRLPPQRPRMFVRFEGRAQELVPTLHRILISVEEMAIYLVWHGEWPTPRQLPDRFPEEGDDVSMELEGIEAYSDGKLVAPLV